MGNDSATGDGDRHGNHENISMISMGNESAPGDGIAMETTRTLFVVGDPETIWVDNCFLNGLQIERPRSAEFGLGAGLAQARPVTSPNFRWNALFDSHTTGLSFRKALAKRKHFL